MATLDRDRAWDLLCRYTESERLRKHGLAVEAVMRAYAGVYGEDPELWGLTGLLHDFDYERWPDQHPASGSAILRAEGYPEEMVEAIRRHGNHLGLQRETLLARCLNACDEITGFVVAVARVRPGGFEGLEPKAVVKKLKDKAFARGVSREDVQQGLEEIGVERDVHIARVIEALTPLGATLLTDGAGGGG
ncbi:MAG: HDIG domain-containing protein [Firmicutes bacterium]|nr:HDIG domain-containing protein [Bacillota bacterium]